MVIFNRRLTGSCRPRTAQQKFSLGVTPLIFPLGVTPLIFLLFCVNELIRDAQRNHFSGLGKPEPLKANLHGWWSRRITQEHRLVYRVEGETLIVMQCRFHYDGK